VALNEHGGRRPHLSPAARAGASGCPRWATPLVVLALLSEPDVVRKILLHLGLPADVPTTAPARHCDEPLFDEDVPCTAPARPPP